MNEHPTAYEPKRRSRVTVVKGASEVPVTLTPLVKGMVTGTLGNVPLTSAVYAQIPLIEGHLDKPLATVMFGEEFEVLGLIDDEVYRDSIRVFRVYREDVPRLILTEGATR